MKTTAAVLLALSGCSGPPPYGTIYNDADRAFIVDSAAHLRSDLRATAEPAPVAAGPGDRGVDDLRRIMRAELDAVVGIARGSGATSAAAREAIEHVERQGPPDPSPAEINEAAIARAESYIPRGRHPSLRSVAERIVRDRAGLARDLDTIDGASR